MDAIKYVVDIAKAFRMKDFIVLTTGALLGYGINYVAPLSLDLYFYKPRNATLQSDLKTANEKAHVAEGTLSNEKTAREQDKNRHNSEITELKEQHRSTLKELNELRSSIKNAKEAADNAPEKKLVRAIGNEKKLPCKGESMVGDLIISTYVNQRVDSSFWVSFMINGGDQDLSFPSWASPIRRIFGVPVQIELLQDAKSCAIRLHVAG